MTTGQWLFEEAAQTGDWESAAIALRAELHRASVEHEAALAKVTADRDALIASVEHAWSRVGGVARVTVAPDPLDIFAAERVRP